MVLTGAFNGVIHFIDQVLIPPSFIDVATFITTNFCSNVASLSPSSPWQPSYDQPVERAILQQQQQQHCSGKFSLILIHTKKISLTS